MFLWTCLEVLRAPLEKARRLAMKELVRTLKINFKRCPPLLKCICCDLPLSPLFRSLQFIIYSVLPQTSLVSPVCSHYYTLHTHRSLDTYSMYTQCGAPRSETAPPRFSTADCSHSLTRDNWSVSGLRFSCPQYCFSYRMIAEEGNLFFSRVCPLWPGCAPISHAQMAPSTFGGLAICVILKEGCTCREAEPIMCL